ATVTSLFQVNQDGQAFRLAIDLLNHEINQGILFQSLATQEAVHGSRAASVVHQDSLALAIQYVRTVTEEMVRKMFEFWIRINFGDDAVALTPIPNLGDTETEDFSAKGLTIARLDLAGYFDPSQYPLLDVELGLPRRTQEETDARAKMKEAAATSIEEAQAAPKPPSAPPLADEVINPRQQRA